MATRPQSAYRPARTFFRIALRLDDYPGFATLYDWAMFKGVLIANRGEVAVRIVKACHQLAIEPVTVHSQADADAMHACLGRWP